MENKISKEWMLENDPEFLRIVFGWKGSMNDLLTTYNAKVFQWNDERKEIRHCIDMIESLIAYDNINNDEKINKYLYGNYNLEKGFIDELIERTKNKVERVQYGVLTDSEGLTYNGLIFKA